MPGSRRTFQDSAVSRIFVTPSPLSVLPDRDHKVSDLSIKSVKCYYEQFALFRFMYYYFAEENNSENLEKMGVMSRRVLPLCSNLCFCCPALRARSRQPVKRYKKLLADIFPRSQGGEPNDRKIGKLCEYASKNPLRIPKQSDSSASEVLSIFDGTSRHSRSNIVNWSSIFFVDIEAVQSQMIMDFITDYLEQKFYKNLRNENIVSVKAVLLVYGNLISSCKEEMPLFASSLLVIVHTLLEQTQHDEMQILGCHALVNFKDNQVDSAYMFNLESLIPKLCQLAEENGDDEKVLRLRSAGLEVLAFMVLFMGEQPHASMDFENIISVTLENYTDMPINRENRQLSQAQEHSPRVPKVEYNRSSFSEISKTSDFVNSKPQDVPPVDANKNPSYWARVCLHNMARSAKEATTVRRVLEPLFHKFDTDKLWLPEKGLAFAVLKYLQMMLEESDDRSHLLLPILIKHLDHKDVTKQPVLQLHIVNVATELSMYVKQHASVTIVGAITDLIKHYRKCLLRSFESSSLREGSDSCYAGLQCALENCISKLSCKVFGCGILATDVGCLDECMKGLSRFLIEVILYTTRSLKQMLWKANKVWMVGCVGDVGLILDIMAVVLENIPTSAAIARANLSALYRTAQVISSIPNITYLGKAFPDALFHHLLLAMSHLDHETRVLAHRVFSIVLIPSLSQPWSIHNLIPSQTGIPSMMSQKVADESLSIQYGNKSKPETIDEGTREKESHIVEHHVKHTTETSSHGSIGPSTSDGKAASSMRLNGRQVSLALSSIWIQATSMENTPANFEAMAHTYTLALSFILSKNSNHVALVRSTSGTLIMMQLDKGCKQAEPSTSLSPSTL
ncbi:hypothetical protein L6452_09026 [Arctium lappa]|uniref:Uncharacterized protein n=1 Tax=Arctium lappa TaxID=4217 RepID=A0ACB9DK18_ARCLA|nr:hypothetical protein L6452_09026 [Arctium lappa]